MIFGLPSHDHTQRYLDFMLAKRSLSLIQALIDLMFMPMMRIGEMFVTMRDRFMPVWVAMLGAGSDGKFMIVKMVLVMHVFVLMLHFLMCMLMFVVFGQMQPDAERHE